MSRLFLLLCLISISFTNFASAHQIKNVGDLRVLLHVDPNDMPYAGTTTTMHVVFNDLSGKFSKDACDCVLLIAPYAELDTIEETGTRIDLATAVREYGMSYQVSHVFPRRDIYAIRLVGKPREPEAFSSFDLTYDIRVELGESIASNEARHTLIDTAMRYLPYGLVGLILVGILMRKRLLPR